MLGARTYVLGAINMSPWGTDNFADQGAVWIWNGPNAAATAAECECVCVAFYKDVFVTHMTPVIVPIIADNFSKLFINGILIGDANGGWGNNTDYPKLGAILLPGHNVFHIQARNGSVGPAGLLVAIIANSSVLAHTDASWAANIVECDKATQVKTSA